jgi:hypothetical protein
MPITFTETLSAGTKRFDFKEDKAYNKYFDFLPFDTLIVQFLGTASAVTVVVNENSSETLKFFGSDKQCKVEHLRVFVLKVTVSGGDVNLVLQNTKPKVKRQKT